MATGTVSKWFGQYLSNVQGKGEIEGLQKTATLCTVGSADVKVQNMFNMRNNITCSVDCK